MPSALGALFVGVHSARLPQFASCTCSPRQIRAAAGLFQRELSWPEKKELRARAQNLLREKKDCTIHLGKAGVTKSFIAAAADALEANELVRVRVGNLYEELPEVIATIEKRCDCVCVHHVGFTFTLFREAGLPRPPKTTLQVAAAVESQEAQEEGPRQGDAEGKKSRAKKKGGRGSGGKKLEEVAKPPAFTVLE